MSTNLSLRAETPAQCRRTFSTRFEVRAKQDGTGGTRYEVDGYATVYQAPYSMRDSFGDYEETVRIGAGAKTLSENPDVVFVFNHDGLPMARTKAGNLLLAEDSTGLHVSAPMLNGSVSLVRDMVTLIEDGVLDEMSFAFRVIRQEWSPDWMQRDIIEYSLHRGDVSVVTFGANPATSVGLRSESDRLQDSRTGAYPLSLAVADAGLIRARSMPR